MGKGKRRQLNAGFVTQQLRKRCMEGTLLLMKLFHACMLK